MYTEFFMDPPENMRLAKAPWWVKQMSSRNLYLSRSGHREGDYEETAGLDLHHRKRVVKEKLG